MNHLSRLLKLDWMLLSRNQMITTSVIVTALYIGVFFLLRHSPAIDKILVMILFNDPALLGFIFIGVGVLLEKSENTLPAVWVTPIPKPFYLWSKIFVLTAISTLCTIAMVMSIYGLEVRWLHLIMGAVLTTSFFGFVGFIIITYVTGINDFILKAAGIFIAMGIPFLAYFGVWEHWIFYLFPTYPAILLLDASVNHFFLSNVWYAYVALIIWNVIACLIALKSLHKLV